MATEKTPIDKDKIHKELDLIQDVVKRMASNSFQVKGWMIGILSAIIVFEKNHLFLSGDGDKWTAVWLNFLLFIPVVCFWYLDAFFLKTERMYREIYKWIVEHRKHTEEYLYDLNTLSREYNGKKYDLGKSIKGIFSVMRSETLLLFYAPPFLFVVALLFYNFCRNH